jgi:hypothetical protein
MVEQNFQARQLDEGFNYIGKEKEENELHAVKETKSVTPCVTALLITFIKVLIKQSNPLVIQL